MLEWGWGERGGKGLYTMGKGDRTFMGGVRSGVGRGSSSWLCVCVMGGGGVGEIN